MKHNVDSLKPVLLIDISMNNYANIVFNTFLKYDNTLPEGKRNSYYIYMYKEQENKYMKKFFRCVEATQKALGGRLSMEDIAYDIMDSFETDIKPELNAVENEIGKFIEPDKNDEDNIYLLRKIQMNAIMLQLAMKLQMYYNRKNDSTIKKLFELNTMFIEKIDDRNVKREYSSDTLTETIRKLVRKIKDFKYERNNMGSVGQRQTS